LKPVSGKAMCRVLENHGWILVRTKGGHRAYQRSGHPGTVVVPVHGNKDLKRGTQNSIMKSAGITEDDGVWACLNRTD
jgi:predicted RNA binding protein YcfA (HicA-like mRNA interferase family)